MAVSADWQVEYNGLLLGDGTDFDIASITGLLDLPDVRSSDRTLLLADGLATGQDNVGGRSIELTLDLWPSDPTQLAGLIAAVQSAFTLQHSAETPMTFRLPGVAYGGARQFTCRTRKRSAPLDLDFLQGHCQFVIQLDGADPRIYDDTLQSLSAALPTAPGGVTFDLTYPVSFGAMPTGGQILATNGGTFETYPTIRIDGPTPAGGFTLSNDTTGRVWRSSTVLTAGQWLTVDMRPGFWTARINDVASRFADVDPTSSWWALQPGDNSISFRAASLTSALATVTWRSAWL